jgi:actin-related protein
VSCPINPLGEIAWDALEDIWLFALTHELGVQPSEHPLLMTDLPAMAEAAQVRMCEVVFETFGAPSLYLANPAVLSLYSQGLSTGVAVDCGNRMQIVPVVDGCAVESAISKTRHGFAGLTEHLSRLLTGRGLYYTTARQMETVRRIKEATCYVASNYEEELARRESEVEVVYQSPDGIEVRIGRERFQCPEAMFDPNMLGLDMPGIHHQLYRVVNSCPIDYRRRLFGSVVLAGGSTLFRGFPQRLEAEVLTLAAEDHRQIGVKIAAPGNRKYLAWIGGSLLASLPNFEDIVMTRDLYLEAGSTTR